MPLDMAREFINVRAGSWRRQQIQGFGRRFEHPRRHSRIDEEAYRAGSLPQPATESRHPLLGLELR
jgi:hypothetical protein